MVIVSYHNLLQITKLEQVNLPVQMSRSANIRKLFFRLPVVGFKTA